MNINLKIWRQKDEKEKGSFKSYKLQNIDPNISFLEMLAEKGIPEGNYQVTQALPDDKWPTRIFSPNGALRFSPLSGLPIPVLRESSKNGLAIHAKDFFPLDAKI